MDAHEESYCDVNTVKHLREIATQHTERTENEHRYAVYLFKNRTGLSKLSPDDNFVFNVALRKLFSETYCLAICVCSRSAISLSLHSHSKTDGVQPVQAGELNVGTQVVELKRQPCIKCDNDDCPGVEALLSLTFSENSPSSLIFIDQCSLDAHQGRWTRLMRKFFRSTRTWVPTVLTALVAAAFLLVPKELFSDCLS